MANIRPIDSIVRKWKEVTPLRATEYAFGIRNPKKDWASEAIAANDTFVKAVTMAAQQGRYKGGVAAAGTTKWQDNSIAKGPNRFSEGVLLSAPAYEAGIVPFHKVIQDTTLPPRGPTGDPTNLNRVAVIDKALHDKKLALRK
uniref:Uncharacterized protein n=1 Tax=viral metagenome TaxID=1070528 RepID=A0A6M3LKB2_9ZZZZ